MVPIGVDGCRVGAKGLPMSANVFVVGSNGCQWVPMGLEFVSMGAAGCRWVPMGANGFRVHADGV